MLYHKKSCLQSVVTFWTDDLNVEELPEFFDNQGFCFGPLPSYVARQLVGTPGCSFAITETDFFLVGGLCLFGGSPLEAYSQTRGESNHHRQFVSDTRVLRYQLSQDIFAITGTEQWPSNFCKWVAIMILQRFLAKQKSAVPLLTKGTRKLRQHYGPSRQCTNRFIGGPHEETVFPT